jgi:lipooligosaccharide transport system permease protein
MTNLQADQLEVQHRGLPIGEGMGRLFDYWLTVYKRTWKASAISSFASPLLYVVAMGYLLGKFIDDDPSKLEGAPTYLAFVVPGLIAAHAMQTAVGETTYPVMGLFKWGKVYDSMIATPLQIRHVVTAHLAFVAFRLASTCAVFMLVLAPFGVFRSWWGPLLAFLSQVLVGMAFATLVYAFTTRIKSEASFGVLFRLGVFPLFLFSGAFFPVDNLGVVGSFVAKLTPLWHGVNLSRTFCVTGSWSEVDWSMTALNAAYLLVLAVVGWRLAVTGLTKRLIT